MTNSSSRILREEERDRVAPVWWQEVGAIPAKSAPVLPRFGAPGGNSGANAESGEQERDPELERAEREAFQRGFAEGKTVGVAQGAAEIQPVIDRLTRSLAELALLRPRIRKEAETDLVKLSLAVARRILHRELTLDPESIDGLIRAALDKLESREVTRVRVHPEQDHAVRVALARFAGTQIIEVVPDGSLQSGDVLFETAHGTLDASIDAQLREIDRGFADRLRR